jgi:hypothetical protein
MDTKVCDSAAGRADAVVAAQVAQEADVWWGGYSSRALLASFAVCFLANVIVIELAYYLNDHHDLRASLARWLIYHCTWFFWLIQLLWGGYRLGSYEYRLTSRRLFCVPGWLFLPLPPIDLADIQKVRTEQTAVQHWLGVGQVIVEGQNRGPIILRGVRDPQRVAQTIQEQAQQRQSNLPPPAVQAAGAEI